MEPINKPQLPVLSVPLWNRGDRLSIEGLNRPVDAINRMLGAPGSPVGLATRSIPVQILVDLYAYSKTLVLAGIPTDPLDGIYLVGGDLVFVDRDADRGIYVVSVGQWPLVYDPDDMEVGWKILITRGWHRANVYHCVNGQEILEFPII